MSRFTAACVLFLATTVAGARSASAQTAGTPASPLPLAVEVLPPSADAGTASSIAWVTDAIASAMPQAGLASISRAPLLLQVQARTRSLGESDAGMRRIVQAEATVSLTLRSITGTGTLGAVRLRGTGTGRDLEAAASNAFSQLFGSDDALISSLRQLRDQAASNFEASCDDVLSNARDRAAARDYDEALAVLMSVPTGAAGCRGRAMNQANAMYLARSNWQCGTALQNATAARAARRFDEAIQHLRHVDPLSPCRNQVTALLTSIAADAAARESRRDAERAERLRRDWTLQMEAIRSVTSIERQRLIVLGRIAESVLTAPRR
jgi:hypothetical protein